MRRGRRRPHHFEVRTLADGVFAAIAQDGGNSLSNAGIVDLGSATLVFDAGLTPRSGLALRRAAEKLTGRRPTYVVNSHYHGDHILGNSAFSPARIVSTARTRELVVSVGKAQLRADRAEARGVLRELRAGTFPLPAVEVPLYEGWMGGLADGRIEFRVVPPDLTFTGSLAIHGTKRSVEILSYGGGHTDSDAFLVVPDARVACLGDLLSIGYHPFASDGHPEEWVEILGRIRKLRLEQLVPGHGAVGGPRYLELMISYFRKLLAQAMRAKRSPVSRTTFVGTHAPAFCAGWEFSRFFPETLGFLYDRAGRR